MERSTFTVDRRGRAISRRRLDGDSAAFAQRTSVSVAVIGSVRLLECIGCSLSDGLM